MTASGHVPRVVQPSRASLYTDYIDPAIPVVIRPDSAARRSDKLLTPDALSRRFKDELISVSIADGRIISATPKMEKLSFKDYAAYVQRAPDGGDLKYAAQVPFDAAAEAAGTDLVKGILPDAALIKAKMLWFGPSGTIAPMHFDESHNFLHQHYGSKQVILISPDHFESFRPGPKDALDGHMSSIDLFSSDQQLDSSCSAPPYLEAILEAGDLLFIPAFWWHRVEALGAAVSVNYWWRPPLMSCLYPAFFRALSAPRVFHHPSAVAEIIDLDGGRVDVRTCRLLSDHGCEFAAAALAGALVTEFCSNVRQFIDSDQDRGDSSADGNSSVAAQLILDGLMKSGVITSSQHRVLRSCVSLGEETRVQASPVKYSPERSREIRALVCELESEIGDLITA